jgi:hypothetical protein
MIVCLEMRLNVHWRRGKVARLAGELASALLQPDNRR